jgi:hypothetical protein
LYDDAGSRAGGSAEKQFLRIRVANLPKVGNPDKQFIRKKKRIRLLTLIV